MKWYNKFLPTIYKDDVYQIDYESLKNQGVKALFFDLDNTLIPYDINIVGEKATNFLEELTKDFKVVIVSNSYYKRVNGAVKHLKDIPFVHFSKKPLKFGFKKALKLSNTLPEETVIIGDQIMTDIFGGSRIKFKERILVYPIKIKSDFLPTKINRMIEKFVIRRIKKRNPEGYKKGLKEYVEK